MRLRPKEMKLTIRPTRELRKKRCMRISMLMTIALANVGVAEEQPSTGDTKYEAHLGAGPYIQSQPYRGADPKVVPSPVIFFDNRLFYVRWARVGMYFYGGENWGASVTAQPRPFGYRAKDSPALAGMAERQNSWEAGFAVAGRNDVGFAELTYFHDILDRSTGSLARLELGTSIASGRWLHVPSILVLWFSDSFNDYYYGVRPEESTAQRPAYSAEAGINFALQEFVMVPLSKDWFVSAEVRADYLASTITSSPIVDDRWMLSGMVSLLYRFTF